MKKTKSVRYELPMELHIKLKTLAAIEQKKLKDLVIEALANHVNTSHTSNTKKP